MNIEEAKEKLNDLDPDAKYDTMIKAAAIITNLLSIYNIKPIIVGGLSVEIYTQNEYATRDIDFVSDGYSVIEEILLTLEFIKDGRYFYREDKEIVVEIPDNYLEGNINKVRKVFLDNELYVYLISIEDIIIDRIRATVNWASEEDKIWGFKVLAYNIDAIDVEYIKKTLYMQKEKKEFENWLNNLK